jgi:lipoate---protein ligase
MKLCDLTLSTPEENLACDEALLDLCEAGECDELLRLWALPQYFVVLGYGNKAATEANLPFCQKLTVPVLRRCTGGGAVLQGPGVLNYSLILRITDPGPFQSIPATNRFILERHRDALASLLMAPVEWRGQTDLAIGGLKFAGNSQRRRRRFLLFHGSFLLHLDLSLVEQALLMPSRQPDYRLNRSHSDFLINLNVPPPTLKTALAKAWNATEPLAPLPLDEVTRLAREKYALDEWNLRF